MNHLEALPSWAAILVAVFVLLGAGFTFVGSIGLLRLKNFYKRVHAPTLGSTLGTFFMVAASITCFSVLDGRPIFHEVLIGVFLTLTTPITLMLLVRAALYRDRKEGSDVVPRAGGGSGTDWVGVPGPDVADHVRHDAEADHRPEREVGIPGPRIAE